MHGGDKPGRRERLLDRADDVQAVGISRPPRGIEQLRADATYQDQVGATAALRQAAHDFDAVHAGHHQIEQQMSGAPTVDRLEELGDARNADAIHAGGFQDQLHGPADGRVVVEQQHPEVGRGAARSCFSGDAAGRRLPRRRRLIRG